MRAMITTTIFAMTLSTGLFAQNKGMKDQSMMEEMHKSMQSMQQMMTNNHMTGDADYDFATMMVHHHQGAVDMAKAYLKKGDDPKIKAMAEKMIKDQEREIADLQAWLKEHPAPAASH